MSAIEIRGVTKQFGPTAVLSDVDLTVPEGATTAILGASGSGKTTLLRMIAGFEQADSGTITIAGRVVDDGRRSVRAQHRGVGYVPQEGALFPHLTVAGNVGFGVGRRDRARVPELIDLVGLSGMAKRFPHQLSGGQQQRVALARALAIRPKVVLLDEPFSSLDASLRDSLRDDVLRVLAETSTTTVLVTHDQDEALALADQIAILRDHVVVACADPRELYQDPPDLATASSVGQTNVLIGQLADGVARCALGTVQVRKSTTTPADGDCRLVLRPEQLVLHGEQERGTVPARVVRLNYHGHDALAHLELDAGQRDALLARVPGEQPLLAGERVWVEVTGRAGAWPVDAEVLDDCPQDIAG